MVKMPPADQSAQIERSSGQRVIPGSGLGFNERFDFAFEGGGPVTSLLAGFLSWMPPGRLLFVYAWESLPIWEVGPCLALCEMEAILFAIFVNAWGNDDIAPVTAHIDFGGDPDGVFYGDAILPEKDVKS